VPSLGVGELLEVERVSVGPSQFAAQSGYSVPHFPFVLIGYDDGTDSEEARRSLFELKPAIPGLVDVYAERWG
jgi:hypothetical protein